MGLGVEERKLVAFFSTTSSSQFLVFVVEHVPFFTHIDFTWNAVTMKIYYNMWLLLCLFMCLCFQPMVQAKHGRDLRVRDVLPVDTVIDELIKEEVSEHVNGDDDQDGRAETLPPPAPRTATGGIINTLMIFLSFLAFLGNAGFLVHVFWLKEKIDHTLAPPKSILPFNNFGLGAG
jgi:hypothetical protein